MSSTTRGRLIRPQIVEVGLLDLIATATDTGDPSLPDGYDADFREPVRLPVEGGGPGTTQRVEKCAQFRAQIELPRVDETKQTFGGNIPQTTLVVVAHFADLEALGLVDSTTGEAMIRTMARLKAAYTLGGKLIQNFERLDLYALQVAPASFGLAGGTRNLLIVTFGQREKGTTNA